MSTIDTPDENGRAGQPADQIPGEVLPYPAPPMTAAGRSSRKDRITNTAPNLAFDLNVEDFASVTTGGSL